MGSAWIFASHGPPLRVYHLTRCGFDLRADTDTELPTDVVEGPRFHEVPNYLADVDDVGHAAHEKGEVK